MRITLTALLCMVTEACLAGGIQTTGSHFDEDQGRNVYTFATSGEGEGLQYGIGLEISLDSKYRDYRKVYSNSDKTVLGFMDTVADRAYTIVLIERLADGKLVVIPDFNKEVERILNDNHVKFDNSDDSFYLKAIEDSKRGTVLDIRAPQDGRWIGPLNVKLLVARDGSIKLQSLERPKPDNL
jgi:hypothetical protein